MAKTHFHDIGGGVCIHLQMCVKGKGLDFHLISLEREGVVAALSGAQAGSQVDLPFLQVVPPVLTVSSLQSANASQCT